MDTSPFEPGYPHPVQHHQQSQHALYGAMTGYDSPGLKFHPATAAMYPDSAADPSHFYPNYFPPGMGGPHEFGSGGGGGREPPTYVESTTTPASSSSSFFFNPGFAHAASTEYYKAGGMSGGVATTPDLCVSGLRAMDMVSEYHKTAAAMTDNFLVKQEGHGDVIGNNDSAMAGGNPLLQYNHVRYSENDIHRLHHHHHQQQQQQQQQNNNALSQIQHVSSQHMQPTKAQMPIPAELPVDGCKLEPKSQADFQGHDEQPMSSPGAINTHLQRQGLQTEHPNLPPPLTQHQQQPQQPAAHDGNDRNAQSSSSSDETQEEGLEGAAECHEQKAYNGSDEQQQTSQENGSAGGDDSGGGSLAGTDKTSNEVKPTLSYIALIAKSILESPQRRLNLGSIYGWIEKNFPYYHNRGQGWRNSVRHNLSLNDCFIKAGRCEDGKGNYWAIHPANMQDFLRGDFRQRRRSRRRGRKKECELGLYHTHHQFANGYLGASGVAAAAAAVASATGGNLGVGTQMAFPPSAASLSNIYSPYTEAERRAYRLDEALLRQSMNNPFFKWYHQTSSPYTPATSPSHTNNAVYNAGSNVPLGVGGSVGGSGSQWHQTYPDNNTQGVYQLNSSFPR